MKKAKLILAGIACMAIVGGAFAFKAARSSNQFYSIAANGQCTVPFLTTLKTTLTAAPGTFVSYSTKATLVPCTTFVTTTI